MERDKTMEKTEERITLREVITRAEYEELRCKRIIAMLNEARVTLEEYKKSLAIKDRDYQVVLQGDISEMMANNYNLVWMRAINANHNVKLIPDVFGVVNYVTDYYAKDKSVIQGVLTATVKACKSDNIKEKLKNVANTFITHMTMGECEAVYKLIQFMKMSKSNIGTMFLNNGRFENRSNRMKARAPPT